LGRLTETLENTDLMAQGEDFQLMGGKGPKRGAKEGEKGA